VTPRRHLREVEQRLARFLPDGSSGTQPGANARARVHCIRDAAKSLEDLMPHIGMVKQSELTARLKQEYPIFHVSSLYERIGNRIANKGKASLRL
jgi:hypothetical protein